MDTRATVSRAAAMALGLGLLLAPGGSAEPPPGGPPGWQREADDALGAGRGVGPRLMTEAEWRAHREQMQRLDGEEREQARRAWHDEMRRRAREKGVTLPETPGPHGRGMGRGRGGGPPR